MNVRELIEALSKLTDEEKELEVALNGKYGTEYATGPFVGFWPATDSGMFKTWDEMIAEGHADGKKVVYLEDEAE
jgi:hypothetical protein